jgi:hypothetical protein
MGFVWPRKTNHRRRIFPAANPRANQCRHPCAPRRPQISVSIRGKTSARRLSADLGMDKSPPHKHGLDEKANHHMQHNCNNKLQFVVFF